ncbi:hypothetical protein ACFQZI_12000 [Mucilaginibacter lutimaris]|uniref:Uncharacterized protein n=1 Tax=Mucilaginibacter lutimaris TaxID=931629 RepID=A0ABW2ZH97_9SPHI
MKKHFYLLLFLAFATQISLAQVRKKAVRTPKPVAAAAPLTVKPVDVPAVIPAPSVDAFVKELLPQIKDNNFVLLINFYEENGTNMAEIMKYPAEAGVIDIRDEQFFDLKKLNYFKSNASTVLVTGDLFKNALFTKGKTHNIFKVKTTGNVTSQNMIAKHDL